jgi:hypothetical protein
LIYSIQRLRGVRVAVVLVERRQLSWHLAAPLIVELQARFKLPVMLVARDDAAWNNAKAIAEFDAVPYLFALLATDDIDWNEMEFAEPEVPF